MMLATASSAQDVSYKVGTALACLDGVVILIGATDTDTRGDEAVHVQMYFAGDFLAGHLPFTVAALDGCEVSVGGDWWIDAAAFNEGYGQWKEAQGGFFTISTSEVAVMLLEATGQ